MLIKISEESMNCNYNDQGRMVDAIVKKDKSEAMYYDQFDQLYYLYSSNNDFEVFENFVISGIQDNHNENY